mmetsp:Transcript_9958/g.37143  ORF Transcript_9958/g.37143 Transcript_9958/m.37143 type:complete len:95 (-) Transcript_9958:403-687(-)
MLCRYFAAELHPFRLVLALHVFGTIFAKLTDKYKDFAQLLLGEFTSKIEGNFFSQFFQVLQFDELGSLEESLFFSQKQTDEQFNKSPKKRLIVL